jgi:hypothetical protein
MSFEIVPYRGSRALPDLRADHLPAPRPAGRRARAGGVPPLRPLALGWRPEDAAAAYRTAGIVPELPPPFVDLLA